MDETTTSWLVSNQDLLASLSYLAIILGVPAAIYQYYRAARREQLDREYGTYNALDEKYLDFLELCFRYPELDIFDIQDVRNKRLTKLQQKQELIAFTLLFSIFERSYLMYSDQSTEIKQRQWSGWEDYIRAFCRRQNFRRAWNLSGATFDKHFENFMAKELAATGENLADSDP